MLLLAFHQRFFRFESGSPKLTTPKFPVLRYVFSKLHEFTVWFFWPAKVSAFITNTVTVLSHHIVLIVLIQVHEAFSLHHIHSVVQWISGCLSPELQNLYTWALHTEQLWIQLLFFHYNTTCLVVPLLTTCTTGWSVSSIVLLYHRFNTWNNTHV